MNTISLPDPESAVDMLRGAIGQIEFARRYTLELLEDIPHDKWFEIPAGFHTNVAWQVGHICVSQYGLLMFRLRGRQPEDLELIPGSFRKAYSRQSFPSSNSELQPTPDELYQRMQRIYERSLDGLQRIDAQMLLEPVDMPYAAFPIKLGAILFCPMHELLHAGQIGLLRRALGLPSVR